MSFFGRFIAINASFVFIKMAVICRTQANDRLFFNQLFLLFFVSIVNKVTKLGLGNDRYYLISSYV